MTERSRAGSFAPSKAARRVAAPRWAASTDARSERSICAMAGRRGSYTQGDRAYPTSGRAPGGSMRRTALGFYFALALVCSPAVASEAPVSDREVARGIRQAEDGDYDAAIITL